MPWARTPIVSVVWAAAVADKDTKETNRGHRGTHRAKDTEDTGAWRRMTDTNDRDEEALNILLA